MEVKELKMLRFLLGITKMDKIRNEYIIPNLITMSQFKHLFSVGVFFCNKCE